MRCNRGVCEDDHSCGYLPSLVHDADDFGMLRSKSGHGIL